MPIFRVKSIKIYTGQKKFTRTPSVASVTNIRYVWILSTAATALIDFDFHIVFKDNPSPCNSILQTIVCQTAEEECKSRKIKAKKAGLPIQMDLRHIPNRGRGQIGNPTNISWLPCIIILLFGKWGFHCNKIALSSYTLLFISTNTQCACNC